MNNSTSLPNRYTVSLDFEAIKLPPFQDILILAKKCPIGMVGINKCMGLIAPENFRLFALEDETVEAILISEIILKRMSFEKVLNILKEKVFPYVSSGEIVKIDFRIRISVDEVEGVL